MILFLDTEFSDLNFAELISVGLVAEDGRQLYFELDNIGPSICSTFTREIVWPLLSGPRLSPIRAADALKAFLAPYGRKITLWTDAPRYDVELLKPFLRKDLSLHIAVPSFEDDAEAACYAAAQQQAFDSGLRRHHALDDALAARHAWMALVRYRAQVLND